MLIDHRKDLYPAAFEAIQEKLSVGSVVVADNVMRSSVIEQFTSDADTQLDERTHGLIEYLKRVRADEDFHTVVLPVGNGLAISTRKQT